MPPKQHHKKRHHFPEKRFSQAQRGVQSSRGLDPNVVVLHPPRHGSSSNFIQFSQEMLPKITAAHGSLGSIISHYEYRDVSIPQFVRTIPFDQMSDNPDTELNIYNISVAEIARMKVKMESEKPKVFGMLWGNMSTESQQLIESEPTWDEVSSSQDPLALFKLIRSTHILGETSGIRVLDQARAKKELGTVSQRAGESHIDWQRRLDNIKRSFPLLGLQEPSEQDMVMIFLTRLDPDHFAGLMVDLENSVIMGTGSYPATMAKAVELVRSHKSVDRNGRATYSSIFSLRSEQHNGNAKKAPKGSKKSDSKSASNKDGSKSTSSASSVASTDANSNGKDSQQKNRRRCFGCGSYDHLLSGCPKSYSSDQLNSSNTQQRSPGVQQRNALTTHAEEVDDNDGQSIFNFGVHMIRTNDTVLECECDHVHITLPTIRTILRSTDIAIDNQAEAHLFGNSELLSDVMKKSKTVGFTGISGSPIVTSMVGFFGGIQDVFYEKRSPINILSWSYLHDHNREIRKISCEDRDIFMLVFPDRRVMEFARKGGLYIHDCSVQESHSFTSTVQENELLYTARDLAKAQVARELQRRLGFPPVASIAHAINTGAITNTSITATDVFRSEKIYGPSVPRLKGTTKNRATPSLDGTHSAPSLLSRGLVSKVVNLHTDIMSCFGILFLLSVGTNIGITIVCALESKSLKCIEKGFNGHLDLLEQRGYITEKVFCDREPSFIAATGILAKRGVELVMSGAGSHEPFVERKIQTVKGIIRSIYHSLPFKIPKFMMIWLVLYAVYCVNLLPTKGGIINMSARHLLTSRPIDIKNDLPFAFGDSAQVFVRDSDNTMKPRTVGAIALLPVGNRGGKFLSKETLAIISSNNFKILPTTRDEVEMMNYLASKPNQEISDMNFTWGGSAVVDDPSEFSGAEINRELGLQPVPKPMSGEIVLQPSSDTDSRGVKKVSPFFSPGSGSNFFGKTDIAATGDQFLSTGVSDNNNILSINSMILQDLKSVTNSNSYRLSDKYVSLQSASQEDSSSIFHLFNTSIQQSLRKHPEASLKAAKIEMKQILDKDGFSGVLPSDLGGKVFLPSMMFLKEKYTPSGEFDKLKARLVGGGHRQDRDLYDKSSTTSPTLSTEALFALAGIAAREGRKVIVMDIGGAYLHAKMNKDLYMKLDKVCTNILCQVDSSYKRFVLSDGTCRVKLNKALYGFIESAKLWYDRANVFLATQGYIRNPHQLCVFNKYNTHGVQCTIGIYVDDFWVSSLDVLMVEEAHGFLEAEFGEVKRSDGPIFSLLGMNIDMCVRGKARITLDGFIDDLMRVTGTTGTCATPASDNLFVIRGDAQKLSAAESKDFHSITASVLYLSKRNLLETQLTTGFLTTRVSAPDVDDMAKLQRLLKYINGAKGIGLSLDFRGATNIVASIDASYGVHGDGKSHSGLCIFLGKGAIMAKSVKQKIVSKSSAEAELICTSDMATDAIYMHDFLTAQGELLSAPDVKQDNQGTMTMLAKGSSSSGRSRHINIRYFWLKERIENNELKVSYMRTEDMVADILTKPLQGGKFYALRKLLLNSED